MIRSFATPLVIADSLTDAVIKSTITGANLTTYIKSTDPVALSSLSLVGTPAADITVTEASIKPAKTTEGTVTYLKSDVAIPLSEFLGMLSAEASKASGIEGAYAPDMGLELEMIVTSGATPFSGHIFWITGA